MSDQSEKVTQVLDSIKTFNVLELVELVKAFEDEFGVSAAAPAVAVAAGPAGGGVRQGVVVANPQNKKCRRLPRGVQQHIGGGSRPEAHEIRIGQC